MAIRGKRCSETCKEEQSKERKDTEKEAEKTVPVCGEKLRLCKGDRL